MTDAITAGGREIAIRGLKRKEVKQLASEGIELGAIAYSDANKVLDRVLEMVLDASEIEFLDDQCNAESLKIFKGILDKTFGNEAEEKNS